MKSHNICIGANKNIEHFALRILAYLGGGNRTFLYFFNTKADDFWQYINNTKCSVLKFAGETVIFFSEDRCVVKSLKKFRRAGLMRSQRMYPEEMEGKKLTYFFYIFLILWKLQMCMMWKIALENFLVFYSKNTFPVHNYVVHFWVLIKSTWPINRVCFMLSTTIIGSYSYRIAPGSNFIIWRVVPIEDVQDWHGQGK